MLAISGGGLVVLLTLIQIAPIKIDPWSKIGSMIKRLAKAVGSVFNGDVLDKVEELDEKVGSLDTKVDKMGQRLETVETSIGEQNAINDRTKILRFGDELLHNEKHSKAHFDQILRDIKEYELYCQTHPRFENGVTGPTVERIKAVYAERLEKNDFL